jgi:hypothetical protein
MGKELHCQVDQKVAGPRLVGRGDGSLPKTPTHRRSGLDPGSGFFLAIHLDREATKDSKAPDQVRGDGEGAVQPPASLRGAEGDAAIQSLRGPLWIASLRSQ